MDSLGLSQSQKSETANFRVFFSFFFWSLKVTCNGYTLKTPTYITERLAGDYVVSGWISFHQTSFCQTHCPTYRVWMSLGNFLHCELSIRRQCFVRAAGNAKERLVSAKVARKGWGWGGGPVHDKDDDSDNNNGRALHVGRSVFSRAAWNRDTKQNLEPWWSTTDFRQTDICQDADNSSAYLYLPSRWSWYCSKEIASFLCLMAMPT